MGAPSNKQRFILTMALLALFGGVLIFMLVMDKPGVEVLIGALVVSTQAGPKWFFDSSPGSERKTELLAKAPPIVEEKLDGAITVR